jgi:superfamily I DNA/RNA helicase/mRNA-degrading endonuclease RelE of RelBE toxin-antitoxin system
LNELATSLVRDPVIAATAVDLEFSVACARCGRSYVVRGAGTGVGPLRCAACGWIITRIDVTVWSGWVESVVAAKRERQLRGELRTRRQSRAQDDADIDRDGMFAELAACMLLCPGHGSEWQRAAEASRPNRGNDLPPDWTGLPRSVEVKYTRHHSPGTGYLIVRPPSGEGPEIRPEHIEDAFYVLITGDLPWLTLLGWADRPMLLARGRRNPVPRRGRQQETWGVHWFSLELPDLLPFPLDRAQGLADFLYVKDDADSVPGGTDMKRTWELTVSPSFLKELAYLPDRIAKQVTNKIEDLTRDPRPDGSVRKRVKCHRQPVYRLRAGDYRIFYTFGEGWVRLLAIRINHEGYDDESIGYERTATVPPPLPEQLETSSDEKPAAPKGPDLPPPTADDRPLPAEITPAMLEALQIPGEFRPQLLACKDEDTLLGVGLADDYLNRLLDALFPPSIEAVAAEPEYVVEDIADLGRVAEKELSLTDFLLKLHPEQEKAVDWTAKGPLLVKGGPGTGKSMVLMHRVRALLNQPPELFEQPPRILFTTYTNCLIDRSKRLLERLLGKDSMRSIEIVNIDKLVSKIARDSGHFPGEILTDSKQLTATLSNGRTSLGIGGRALSGLRDSYLLDEFKWIIEGRGLAGREEYRSTDRSGRGIGLNPAQRDAVWTFYEAFAADLARQGCCTFERARQLALEAVLAGKYRQRYSHVFIDEVQDLTPVGVRLLVALAHTPENVCLAMDSNQSVYSRGFGWRHIHDGLRVKGRTVRLKRGYRTTQEIAAAVVPFLSAGGESDSETLGMEDSPPGARPTLHGYRTPGGQVRAIANFLRAARLRVRVDWSGTAVFCATKQEANGMAGRLRAEGVPACFADGSRGLPSGDQVAVMTIHNSKGLEFPVAALAVPPTWEYPWARYGSTDERAEDNATARRLFFVGATRAMRELLLTYPVNSPVPILEHLDETLWQRTEESELACRGVTRGRPESQR